MLKVIFGHLTNYKSNRILQMECPKITFKSNEIKKDMNKKAVFRPERPFLALMKVS